MRSVLLAMFVVVMFGSSVHADIFGTGDNQFAIDFVTMTANPGVTRSVNTIGAAIQTYTPGEGLGDYTDPGYNYGIGVYEITNDQWNKFMAELGMPVTGEPADAYDDDCSWTDEDKPTCSVSWYEAAQFVNWLNTSTGHQAAYKFTGTQGTGDYAFEVWSEDEAAGGTNLYRHKDAYYYLPTEDEWVKAAYWNGSEIQLWATPDDEVPVRGVDATYYPSASTWIVGSGAEELNGTFDMMGNAWEWMEGQWEDDPYVSDGYRARRGSSYLGSGNYLASSRRYALLSDYEAFDVGLRVACRVPEPATFSLFLLAGLTTLRRRR